MEYLASDQVAAEFYERSLFVPGHPASRSGASTTRHATPQGKAALKVFARAYRKLSPIANKLQGYVNNRVIFNAVISRLSQAIAGELSLDEA